MASSTFSVRVDSGMKKRLEKLAESTGRSRSFLTAEALNEYLDVNEWKVAGIRQAISSLDKGEGMSHADVRRTIKSWERRSGRAPAKRVRA
jgi:RHH-type transcriptional regulator, rel operon repressor / antitoxin RelB